MNLWQYSNKGKLKITFTYRVNNTFSQNIKTSDYVNFNLFKENSYALARYLIELNSFIDKN